MLAHATRDLTAQAATKAVSRQRERLLGWQGGQTPTDRERAVGLMLTVTLGLANELEVDSLQALRSVLLEESP